MKLITNIINRIKYRFEICQEPECYKRHAVPCFYPDWEGESDGEPDCFYCITHAKQAGFCWYCGTFNAGIESFDFSHLGLCDNCEDQYRHDVDFGDDYERGYDDDEWDDDDPYDGVIVYGQDIAYTASVDEEIPF